MQKLDAVEKARALMTEGKEWGAFTWLFEKGRVREAADLATEALAEANQKVKSSWSGELKRAYAELESNAEVQTGNSKIHEAARRVKEADDEAYRTTMEAEELFAEAERRMNSDMACQAAQKALDSYDLRESAIRKAEAARRVAEEL